MNGDCMSRSEAMHVTHVRLTSSRTERIAPLRMTTMLKKLLTAAAAAAALAGATLATTSSAQAGYGHGYGHGHGYRYGYVKVYRPHYCFKKVKYTYHGPVWVKVCH
jgi:hypothetical protein